MKTADFSYLVKVFPTVKVNCYHRSVPVKLHEEETCSYSASNPVLIEPSPKVTTPQPGVYHEPKTKGYPREKVFERVCVLLKDSKEEAVIEECNVYLSGSKYALRVKVLDDNATSIIVNDTDLIAVPPVENDWVLVAHGKEVGLEGCFICKDGCKSISLALRAITFSQCF